MGCIRCKSVEMRKKMNSDPKDENENIKNEDSKKDDKLEEKNEEKKIELKKKYNEIKSNLELIIKEKEKEKEKNEYYQNIILYIAKINTDNNDINEDKIKELKIKSENLDKKLKLKEDNKKEIIEEKNKIEKLLELIKSNKINEIESINQKVTEIDKELNINGDSKILLKFEPEINENSDKLNNIKNEWKSFEDSKKSIEELKNIITNKINELNHIKKEINELINSLKEEPIIEDKFTNNSMLLSISKIENNENNQINKEPPKNGKPQVLINNWNENCYIYDEYDLYDINYELIIIGLSGKLAKKKFPYESSHNFPKNKLIEIVEFEIDNNKIDNYNFNEENSKLIFSTLLKGSQETKIHLKYKESSKIESEIIQRKIFIKDYYGISHNLSGRYAIFNLIIKNNFEVINFKDEFFIKAGEGEYKFEGEIPKEGKRTEVIISKKEAKYSFFNKEKVETIDEKDIFDTKLIMNYCFEKGGNQNIKNITRQVKPFNNITLDDKKKQYEINFINIKQKFGEVEIKGELINKCRGAWKVDLTDEEIENKIPQDYKDDKVELKNIANKIINDYDEIHKNDIIKITDIAKIGKWIKNNIKYKDDYKEEEQSSALQIYNKKIGVCKQFTILFNGLLYSLGYKCIYVGGFVFEKKTSFNGDDAHAWSLVRVNGNWLPFDATWGIFTGKLPVCHIFEAYFPKKKVMQSSIDKLKDFEESRTNKIGGKFIE